MISASFLNLIWFSKKNNVPKSKESLNQFKIQFQNIVLCHLKFQAQSILLLVHVEESSLSYYLTSLHF